MIQPEKRTVLTHFTWKPYGGLSPRQSYQVFREFHDFDGDLVPVGWQGRYRAYNYFPYDDGLTLAFDTIEGLRLIRLQMRPDAQNDIGSNLLQFFQCLEEEASPQLSVEE